MSRLRWKIFLFCVKHSDLYQCLHHQVVTLLKKKNYPKVFCIGDVKTGTSSLYKALGILGYRRVRLFKWGEMLNRKWIAYLDYIEDLRKKQWQPYIKDIKKYNYDVYADFPMGYDKLYQSIDKAFPNSKFILTMRDSQSFTNSFENYFKGSPWELKKPIELKQRIREFEERNKEVIEYFKNKPTKLLILNVFDGEGWTELCNFLKKPIPSKPFPHKNIGKYKKK